MKKLLGIILLGLLLNVNAYAGMDELGNYIEEKKVEEAAAAPKAMKKSAMKKAKAEAPPTETLRQALERFLRSKGDEGGKLVEFMFDN